ncbi:MAG TPA: ketol-acid reductoisomerase [Fimbriimonadales bacterium]|nr:ketol-acid reductoisomerase [Fimbriimonadales bacterium]
MAKIWRDEELSLSPLRDKTIAVLGFGSQGRAQSLNLRDSGLSVVVGLREGSESFNQAKECGLETAEIGEACAMSDVLAVLIPERAQKEVFEKYLNPNAKQNAHVIFAHGYNIVYEIVTPREDLKISLVAPKGIGPRLRSFFEQGSGVPALIASRNDDLEIAKAYAKALGCGRVAVIESSFREETETDLFGEQVVLCGGLVELARSAFMTLVEAGYSPEAAYFECVYEIKLIADLIFEYGIAGMIEKISDTAQFGAMTQGKRIIDDHVKEEMKRLLKNIRSGDFAQTFTKEQENNLKNVFEWRESLKKELLEEVRRKLNL